MGTYKFRWKASGSLGFTEFETEECSTKHALENLLQHLCSRYSDGSRESYGEFWILFPGAAEWRPMRIFMRGHECDSINYPAVFRAEHFEIG